MSETGKKFEGVMPREISVEDGLLLRLLQPEDAGRIMAILAADPGIRERVTWTHRLSSERVAELTIAKIQRNSFRYGIVKDDQLVGYVGGWEDDEGYFDGVPKPNEYGFGYFVDPAFRGQGIVLKSTQAMMEAIEDTLPIKQYAVYVADDNPTSQAILEKLGFTPTDLVYDEPIMHCKERRWEKVVDE